MSTLVVSESFKEELDLSDLYALLGIERNATFEEIRLAYRRLAKEHHPDLGGSYEAFTKIQLAHDVLTDKKRRAKYDVTGEFDETTPDITEPTALGMISDLLDFVFVQLINSGRDPTTVDIIQLTREAFTEELKKYKGGIENINTAIRLWKKVVKRIRNKKDKRPLVYDLVKLKILNMEKSKKLLRQKVAAVEMAIDILSDTSFDVEFINRFGSIQWTSTQII